MQEIGCWPKGIDVVQGSVTRTYSVFSLGLWIIRACHYF